MKPVRMVCSHCGNDRVFRDAWVEWDVETQAWVIADIFDYAYCNDCEGETSIDTEDA